MLVSREIISGRAKWKCSCSCGVSKTIREDQIKSGHTASCGCLSVEKSAQRFTTHGESKRHEFSIWRGMINRCHNEKSTSFKYYGGKGIKVCDRWHDPSKFFEDMGEPKAGQEIDRIDTGGDYEPRNCRWVTKRENMNNRSTTRMLTVDGLSLPASVWAEITGVPLKTIHTRLHRKWPHERVIQSTDFRRK